MSTGTDELQYSGMTRIAGQTENAALDVEPICGKNRAAVESVERAGAMLGASKTVSTTALALRVGASDATNRRGIFVQNKGTLSVFLGPATVTTANGIELAIGASMFLAIGEAATLYAIAASGSHDVRVLEVT